MTYLLPKTREARAYGSVGASLGMVSAAAFPDAASGWTGYPGVNQEPWQVIAFLLLSWWTGTAHQVHQLFFRWRWCALVRMMASRNYVIGVGVALLAGMIAWGVFRSGRVAVAAMIVVGIAATSERDVRGMR